MKEPQINSLTENEGAQAPLAVSGSEATLLDRYLDLMRKKGIELSSDDPLLTAANSSKKPFHISLPPSSSSIPLVSIIIPIFNRLSFTCECVASLLEHTPQPIQIIFIDNDSNEGAVQWLQSLKKNDSRIELVLKNKNKGVAAACNLGIRKAIGRYIVILNDNVIVTPKWLSGLLECHSSIHNTGITGPLTNGASGIQGVRITDYSKAGGLEQFALQFREKNRFRTVFSRGIAGFCMLFEKELCNKIGFFDETFGNENYDDDYCLRAAIAGCRNVIAGDVYVHHNNGALSGAANIDYRKNITVTGKLFWEKWSKPVTDKILLVKIALCKAKEELQKLFFEERYPEADELIGRFTREYPNSHELFDFYIEMKSGREHSSERNGLHLLRKAEDARKSGECEYAGALVLKGFNLEPWRPELIAAVQNLSKKNSEELVSMIDEALCLFPDSKGLARLNIIVGLDAVSALNATEQFILSFGADDHIIELGLKLRRSIGKYQRESLTGKSISLCMIVRNEEPFIARCLLSCKLYVHELVIVDTGSTDRTRQIAEVFGATVIDQPWNDDFSAARNGSLRAAKSDWILVMDADEVLSPKDFDIFVKVLDETKSPTAFLITTRNYTNNKSLDGFRPCNGEYLQEEQGSGWTPSTKTRLFPSNMNIFFEGFVHELVDPSIKAANIKTEEHPLVVHHYGNLEESRTEQKMQLYYSLGLKKLNSGNRDDLKALYELAIQAAELKLLDEAANLWQKFIQIEKSYAPAWFNFGYVLLKKGMIDEAWMANEQALKIDPEHNAAHINHALCAFCKLDSYEAALIIQSELNRKPDDVTLLVLKELCRNAEEAIEGLRKIIAKGYQITMFIIETATIMEMTGKKEKTVFLITILKMLH